MYKSNIIKALFFIVLFSFMKSSFADGGFFTMACTVSVECPAGQSGSITYKGTFSNRVIDSCKDVTKRTQYYINAGSLKQISNTCISIAPVVSFSYYGYNNSVQACPATQPQGQVNIQQSYEVWSDGSVRNVSGWYETSRSCTAVLSYYGYNNSAQACPATQPQGQVNVQQRYEVWTDGSTRNASAWYETSRSCAAIKTSTQNDYRSYNCPSNQSGAITQTRTYDVWSDGTNRNYSAWNVSSNTCKSAPLIASTEKRLGNCPEGYKGYIRYQWVVYYSNDSYSAYDADGKTISYTLSTPHQQEIVESNNCTLIPSQMVTSKPGNETVTCDSFYNSVKGTYLGTVTKYGNYVSSYNSSTKQTSTVFNVTSVDVTSCSADPEKMITTESITESCASDQTGMITKNRYLATDSNGNKSYPYGSDYTITSNTCAGISSDTSNTKMINANENSLIENLSLMSSMLSDPAYSANIVNKIKSQTIKSGEKHRLNLVINDASSGKYNIDNVSKVITTFKNIIGDNAEFKITLPRTIDKYIGNGEIRNGNQIYLTSSVLNGDTLTVKYIDTSVHDRMKMPIEQITHIKLFNGDLSGIIFEQD
jgi:hypothetical protein